MNTVLVDRLWPAARQPALRAVLLALAGSLLLTASAKVSIPMWPVPMTMQTLAVLLIGVAYGARLGVATVALYLFEGAIGLPVFASPERGLGLAYMAGPTGGYLAGFLIAAGVMGWLADRGWTRDGALVANLIIGSAIPFVTGVAWLAGFVGFDRALNLGLVPFGLGAGVKLLLAYAILTAARRLLRD